MAVSWQSGCTPRSPCEGTSRSLLSAWRPPGRRPYVRQVHPGPFASYRRRSRPRSAAAERNADVRRVPPLPRGRVSYEREPFRPHCSIGRPLERTRSPRVALAENRRVTSALSSIAVSRLPVSVCAHHVTRRAGGTRATVDNVSAILIDILIDQSPPPPASSRVISSS